MNFPTSIWSVILSIRQDPDRVKEQIVRTYQQPVFEFIRRQGLTHEDAEDISQEVFVRICREEFLVKADREKGKFRTLLLAVTKNVIACFRRFELSERRDRRRQIALGNIEVPVDAPSDDEFDLLWVKNLVAQAMERLKDDPVMAALRLQLEGKSYQEISESMHKQIHDVTNYIHRAKERLRREIEKMIGQYALQEDVSAEVAALVKHL